MGNVAGADRRPPGAAAPPPVVSAPVLGRPGAATPDVAAVAGQPTAGAAATRAGANRTTSPETTASPVPWVLEDPVARARRLEDFYDVPRRQIGEGHYGIVRLATSRLDGTRVAVKSVFKKRAVYCELLRNELSVLRSLDHQNIVRLHDVFEDETTVHLVFELCMGGELFDPISDRNFRFTERQASRLVRRLLDAIRFCHEAGVVHRDLKPENVLLTNPGVDSDLKVIDFGLATFVRPDQLLTRHVGTPYYVAPEVLGKSYGKSCDLWSVGIITFTLLCGFPPFWGDTEREIYGRIRRGYYAFEGPDWETRSAASKDFIERLLERDPAKRLSAEDAMNHPWILHEGEVPEAGEAAAATIHKLRWYAALPLLKRLAIWLAASTPGCDERTCREQFAAFAPRAAGLVPPATGASTVTVPAATASAGAASRTCDACADDDASSTGIRFGGRAPTLLLDGGLVTSATDGRVFSSAAGSGIIRVPVRSYDRGLPVTGEIATASPVPGSISPGTQFGFVPHAPVDGFTTTTTTAATTFRGAGAATGAAAAAAGDGRGCDEVIDPECPITAAFGLKPRPRAKFVNGLLRGVAELTAVARGGSAAAAPARAIHAAAPAAAAGAASCGPAAATSARGGGAHADAPTTSSCGGATATSTSTTAGVDVADVYDALSRVDTRCTPAEAAHLLRGLDLDGDGSASFRDFSAAMLPRLRYMDGDKVVELFNALDADCDGHICADDVAAVLTRIAGAPASRAATALRAAAAAAAVHEADLDGDGVVSLGDFLALMAGNEQHIL